LKTLSDFEADILACSGCWWYCVAVVRVVRTNRKTRKIDVIVDFIKS